jgi:hypothetical protein
MKFNASKTTLPTGKITISYPKGTVFLGVSLVEPTQQNQYPMVVLYMASPVLPTASNAQSFDSWSISVINEWSQFEKTLLSENDHADDVGNYIGHAVNSVACWYVFGKKLP